ncbi:uncharacterized protein LOC117537001 isoform X2 [Gymnodraco acuticeps]|uniref:Uncharacterized protein LOC117537001 isoform X2 n=1 Tax=Gymnodraco acuticeps TaxID=8218 RepID=A0A6P8TJX1_GYMAC|nr:uncharacterized protein LOC117537001 isoform X2 [Gymnodraco acuticeps]
MGSKVSTTKKKQQKTKERSGILRSFSSSVRKNTEAEWVDNNRSKLIQNVVLVMPIADELLQRNVIRSEMYANIETCRTSHEQMRGLYKALTTVKAKCAFYKILKENQPELCDKEATEKPKAFGRKQNKDDLEGPDKGGRVTRSLDKPNVFKKKENISSEHLERVKSLSAQGESKINFNGIFSCGRGGHRNSL